MICGKAILSASVIRNSKHSDEMVGNSKLLQKLKPADVDRWHATPEKARAEKTVADLALAQSALAIGWCPRRVALGLGKLADDALLFPKLDGSPQSPRAFAKE